MSGNNTLLREIRIKAIAQWEVGYMFLFDNVLLTSSFYFRLSPSIRKVLKSNKKSFLQSKIKLISCPLRETELHISSGPTDSHYARDENSDDDDDDDSSLSDSIWDQSYDVLGVPPVHRRSQMDFAAHA
jgi:hypothetical protein